MGKARIAAAVAVLALVAGAAFLAYWYFSPGGSSACLSYRSGTKVVVQTDRSVFGAVTEYKIPGQDRWPNAVTTDKDGSVWFVEQDVPGLGHLFPSNGTLVEYPWPGYPTPKLPDCIPYVSASGIAVWNGRVWAADEFGNSIVGVDPADGSVRSINVSGIAQFPYWLSAGPDGALWFTSDSSPAKLGRIQAAMNVSSIALSGLGRDQPLQLDFVNSSLAFLSAINEGTNSTTHACVCDGRIYSFDPSSATSSVTPLLVGGGHRLVLPTSVSYSDGAVWVAQHGSSTVASYSLASGVWTNYPTSIVPWTDTTLPLLVDASGGKVWFNEHLANKIALLDPASATLTEYSESAVPATGASGIQNDLSIHGTEGGAWFTSMSGNYVGYVDGSHDPGIHVTASGGNAARLAPGENATFHIQVSGAWASTLNVNVSDSENPQSVPTLIQIVPDADEIAPGASSPYVFGVKVAAGLSTQAGDYTVAISVRNGNVQETAYLFITVT